MASVPAPDPLLRAHGLTKEFSHHRVIARGASGRLRAVDNVSFDIQPGEAVGIVGESGSGKTTVARCVLRLIEPSSGDIRFDGKPVLDLSRAELRAFRRRAQIVFQDPYASLDQRFTVLRALAEPLVVHRMCARSAIPARAAELLRMVGLSDDFLPRYRHELSGGEAQRVAIARALATEPRLLVLDEPTSALDASARLKVLTLLRELRQGLGMSYLAISHDLNMIRFLCDRVLVVYLGRVVEDASAEKLFAAPEHPYTQALLSATPMLGSANRPVRIRLRETGEVSPPAGGCALAPRCPHVVDECRVRPQHLEEISEGHRVACHRVTAGELGAAAPDFANAVGSRKGKERE